MLESVRAHTSHVFLRKKLIKILTNIHLCTIYVIKTINCNRDLKKKKKTWFGGKKTDAKIRLQINLLHPIAKKKKKKINKPNNHLATLKKNQKTIRNGNSFHDLEKALSLAIMKHIMTHYTQCMKLNSPGENMKINKFSWGFPRRNLKPLKVNNTF